MSLEINLDSGKLKVGADIFPVRIAGFYRQCIGNLDYSASETTLKDTGLRMYIGYIEQGLGYEKGLPSIRKAYLEIMVLGYNVKYQVEYASVNTNGSWTPLKSDQITSTSLTRKHHRWIDITKDYEGGAPIDIRFLACNYDGTNNGRIESACLTLIILEAQQD